MYRLREMPYIGDVLARRLADVGIDNPEELRKVGSKEAFARIRRVDAGACFSMLCALEGAVREVRWHYLEDAVKRDLKEYYDSLRGS